jgi:hypothetical protein
MRREREATNYTHKNSFFSVDHFFLKRKNYIVCSSTIDALCSFLRDI